MRDTKLGTFAAAFAVAGVLGLGAVALDGAVSSGPAVGAVVSEVSQRVEQLGVQQAASEAALEDDYTWG